MPIKCAHFFPTKVLNILQGLLVSAGFFAFAYNCWYLWAFTVDDAYISMRYARNLASGFGLAWNPGSQLVEGYTSFAHVLLLSIPAALGYDLVAAAKILGILASCAAAMLLIFYSRKSASTGAFALTACLLASPSLALHSVAGLETTLFGFVALALVALALELLTRKSTRLAAWFSITSLALGLIRPEGVLLSAASLIALLCLSPGDKRQYLVLAYLKWFCLPGLLYFLWRTWYFESLFPNTFYVKSALAAAGEWSLKSSFNYILEFSYIYLPPFLIALTYSLARKQLSRELLFGLCVLLPFTLFYLSVDTKLMGYCYRFLLPIFPAAILLSFVPLRELSQKLCPADLHSSRGKQDSPAPRIALSAIFVSISIALFAGYNFLLWRAADNRSVWWWRDVYSPALSGTHELLGRTLAKFPGDYTLAINDAGAAPYYAANWKVIDLGRLNDRILARKGFSAQEVYRRNPDLLVTLNFDAQTINTEQSKQLLTAPEYERYKLLAKMEFEPRYWLFLLLRRDHLNSALASQLVELNDYPQDGESFHLPIINRDDMGQLIKGPFRFANGLMFRRVLLTPSQLAIDLQTEKGINRNYKVFVHVYSGTDESPRELSDFYPLLPTSTLVKGASSLNEISFKTRLGPNDRVHIGLFDEADPSFTRLQLIDGESFIALTPEEGANTASH